MTSDSKPVKMLPATPKHALPNVHTPKQRARTAYELRLQGYQWVAIAEMLGYSSGNAAQRAGQRHEASLPPRVEDLQQNITTHEQRLEDLYRIARTSLEGDRPSPAMVKAALEALRQIATLQGTTERKTDPEPDNLDRVVRMILAMGNVTFPEEGDPFAAEDVVLAEIVTEEEERAARARQVQRFVPPSDIDPDDVVSPDPGEVLSRFEEESDASRAHRGRLSASLMRDD